MFDSYLNRVTHGGTTAHVGNVIRHDTDTIIDQTWFDDPQARLAYIYDYHHDPQPYVNQDRTPDKDIQMAVPIKFIITQYPTVSKDQVEYHIQFKSDAVRWPYFDDDVGKFGGKYPVGLFIDIPDDKGIYNRWLIMGFEYALGLLKYSVLPCNYILHWVQGGKKHDAAAVIRLRNSYNSGRYKCRCA